MVSKINKIFDLLDDWRNIPNYQLERRADIFFSIYLHDVIEKKTKIPIHPILIPEFPINIKTLFPEINTNKSYKIDYVLFSKDVTTAIFVELKTDMSSIREKQNNYIENALNTNFSKLINGLIDIFIATTSKEKYFNLFKKLSDIGIINLPSTLHLKILSSNLQEINKEISKIEIVKTIEQNKFYYLRPNTASEKTITFSEFISMIDDNDDELTKRFIVSLNKWAKKKAGHRGI